MEQSTISMKNEMIRIQYQVTAEVPLEPQSIEETGLSTITKNVMTTIHQKMMDAIKHE